MNARSFCLTNHSFNGTFYISRLRLEVTKRKIKTTHMIPVKLQPVPPPYNYIFSPNLVLEVLCCPIYFFVEITSNGMSSGVARSHKHSVYRSLDIQLSQRKSVGEKLPFIMTLSWSPSHLGDCTGSGMVDVPAAAFPKIPPFPSGSSETGDRVSGSA